MVGNSFTSYYHKSMATAGSWTPFVGVIFSYLVYAVFTAVFRLLYHSLRGFPGPKLAALTRWYKAYYDLVRDGGLLEHIEALHEKYGPVVRIGPNELHFSDPRAYAIIYATGSKFTKDPHFYRCFDVNESSFGMTNPRDSTIRRNMLGTLFSRRSILKLEGVIQAKVDKLVDRLLSYESRKSANLHLAFRATTLDIITSYCFATCNDTLDAEDFCHPILIGMENSLPMFWVFKHFPVVNSFLKAIPGWLAPYLNSDLKAVVDLRKQVMAQIDEILEIPASLEDAEHEIIYHHLLTPQTGKEKYPLPSRSSLFDEAITLRFAGGDTVGSTCTVGTHYVLSEPTVHTKLFRELCGAWPEASMPMTYEELENLPYLTAVIKESLRMAHGVITPLPRVVGPTGTDIAGTHVPAGTVVSIGSKRLHHDPDIFIDPLKFSPERWLQPDSQDLEKYLVPFSHGPRSCLGVNLAWCELYLILGNVFRKLDLEADIASVGDLRCREYFVPYYRGKHLQARVKHRAY